MTIGSFDIFSCWGVSVERFLVDLYVRVHVFAGGGVCSYKTMEISKNTTQNKINRGY